MEAKTPSGKFLLPPETIQNLILNIREQKVMLDRDLAELYGLETKRLNEQVKRNINRFPADFMFQLTKEEKEEVVANCDRFSTLKYSTTNPYAFTEHGAVMLASVLNSEQAVHTSVLVVRAFVELKKWLVSHEALAKKISALEQKYDHRFSVVFQVLKEIIDHPKPPRKPIGFVKEMDNEKAKE